MILPYLDYGMLFMSSCNEFVIQRLQKLQSKVLKCALGMNRNTGTRQIHNLTGVLMIKDRIRYSQLVFIHHQILTSSNLFTVTNGPHDLHNPRTGSTDQNQIILSRPKTEHFRKSLYYGGLNEWNRLPQDMRNCTTLSSFKYRLKSSIIDSYRG